MVFVVDIDNDPAPFDMLVLPSKGLYDQMVKAHKQVAEVSAYYHNQYELWVAAGKPTHRNRGNLVAEGFDVLPWMRHVDIDKYLEQLMLRIRYVGMSVNEYIEVEYRDFVRYAEPMCRFTDA